MASGKWLAIILGGIVTGSTIAAPPARAQYLASYLNSQRDNNPILHQ